MPRLGLVHLADSNKHAPGQGHLDLHSILQTLRDEGYDGFISFEVLPLPTPGKAARGAVSVVRHALRGRDLRANQED
jgi:sugar phosphate isomerase/epimerase